MNYRSRESVSKPTISLWSFRVGIGIRF